ncbi:MAG: helix-turn-helix domain-containing protein [Acidobacteria bacterium]|nr:helix-turn-helix domain-containing protein [Acidobacteriota bacterium]
MEKQHALHCEKLLLRPSTAFEMADVPRSTGYLLIKSGEWPAIRIGRAIRIPMAGLKAWIERKLTKNE